MLDLESGQYFTLNFSKVVFLFCSKDVITSWYWLLPIVEKAQYMLPLLNALFRAVLATGQGHLVITK